MIRINLLPFRRARAKENIRRRISIFVLSLLLLAVSLFGYHLRLADRVATGARKMAEAEAELARFEKKLNEIDAIEKRLASIRRKTAVIEDLASSRCSSVRMLDAMTRLVVAERMYLTRLKIGENLLEVTGIAADNRTIADFMTRLEGSGLFEKVGLKSVAADPRHDGRVLQRFSIRGERRPRREPRKEGRE